AGSDSNGLETFVTGHSNCQFFIVGSCFLFITNGMQTVGKRFKCLLCVVSSENKTISELWRDKLGDLKQKWKRALIYMIAKTGINQTNTKLLHALGEKKHGYVSVLTLTDSPFRTG